MIEVVAFPACVSGVVGRIPVAGFAAAAVMTGQREPGVKVRIIVPAVHVVAGEAIAESFPLRMLRRSSDGPVAVGTLIHIGHLECYQITVAIRAIKSAMSSDHDKGLTGVIEGRRRPGFFIVTPFAIGSEFALVGLFVADGALAYGGVELSAGVAALAIGSLMGAAQWESRFRVVVIYMRLYDFPGIGGMTNLAWEFKPLVRNFYKRRIRYRKM